ncbi:MAG TPA: hypothetical protein VK447_04040 [Myxococcaceae bacterium]|nr:hypothetical protein [Myxococcaceae bacterium]
MHHERSATARRSEHILRFSTAGSALRAILLAVLLAGCEGGGTGGPDAGEPFPRYDVTDLGTLGGGTSEAYAINNAGQVVGQAGGRAFLWDATLGMRDVGAPCTGRATAINAHGMVAGDGSCPGMQGSRAFSWANGQHTILPLPPSGTFSHAYGINDQGQIVGSADYSTDSSNYLYTNAFLWSEGAVRPLLAPRAFHYGTARGINASGQIVGSETYISSSTTTNAFHWKDGKAEFLPVGQSQAITAGPEYYAHAINGAGQIAGVAMTRPGGTPTWSAVIWENGTGRVLGSGEAYAINEAGHVVGATLGYHTPDSRALLWKDGRFVDLNGRIDAGSGWVLLRARGINDQGQIVGTGLLDGHPRAFLLTPIAPR